MEHPDPLLLLALYAAALFALGVWKRAELLEWLSHISRPAAYSVLLIVVGSTILQAFPLDRGAYPIVSWTMYTSATTPSSTWKLEVVRESGARGHLPVGPNLRGPDPRALMRHVYTRSRVTEGPDRERATSGLSELSVYLDALVILDQRRNPDDPIRSVELKGCQALPSTLQVECDPMIHSWEYGSSHAP